MTLDNYMTFATIVECKSLSLAAEKLHVTKSAVSHAVSRMESELRMPLFYRTHTGWTLTSEGKRILPFVYSIIRENDRFF